MGKIAVMTDSNSGITQAKGKELGVYVLPMPFYINDELFFEDITLTQEEFYKRLEEDADIKTSQPAPGDVMELWDKVLEEYDEIVYIPMSSGLSSSCETAMMLAQDYDGKVQVVDNRRVSTPQKQSVLDALELVKEGKTAAEIKEILDQGAYKSSIYVTVDTLKYLKKGGRVTLAAAALGTLLRIKPVLSIQGEKLDLFSKARTVKNAKTTMIAQIKKELEERFNSPDGANMHLAVAYTCDKEAATQWKEEVEAEFPGCEVVMNPLSLSVSCHIGPGAIAIACSKKINVE